MSLKNQAIHNHAAGRITPESKSDSDFPLTLKISKYGKIRRRAKSR